MFLKFFSLDNFIDFSVDLTFFKSLIRLPNLKVLGISNNTLQTEGFDMLFSNLKINKVLEDLTFDGFKKFQLKITRADING